MAACLSVMCSAERTFSKKFVGHLANLAADKVLPAVRAMLVLLLCFPPRTAGLSVQHVLGIELFALYWIELE